MYHFTLVRCHLTKTSIFSLELKHTQALYNILYQNSEKERNRAMCDVLFFKQILFSYPEN